MYGMNSGVCVQAIRAICGSGDLACWVGPCQSVPGDTKSARQCPNAVTLDGLISRTSPHTHAGLQVVQLPLKIVQTAALLEIVHAATGLVRAPLFTTRALQQRQH